METEILWDIANIERETIDGYVYVAHFTLKASDGVYTANAHGSVSFDRPEKLIPFDSLTREIVMTWIKDELGEEKIKEAEEALVKQIEEKRSPTKAVGMPWSN